MSRAAIYVRISRDRVGAGLGVQRQEADCRELADRIGMTVIQAYVDNDLSAYSGKPRPAYRQLLADVEAGRIDAVLAWHTDRLHRSPTELETYIAACEARGVPTHTVKAGPLDLATPSGRLVARQLGAVARYEVEHQVERQQRAKLQAATAGKWPGGQRPFGFEPDGVTLRAAEAKVIAKAIDDVLNGSSLRALAAGLNQRGVRTSTGREWKATELRRMLMRARNAGLREHRGQIIGPAAWKSIVSEDKWRGVCAILTDPKRRQSFATNRTWMLSGIARCGVCGSTLRGDLLRNARGSVPIYTCRDGKCVGRNAHMTDLLISGLVVERLSRPDAADLLRPDDGPDTVAMQTEVEALRARLNELAGLFADGGIDGQQLREATQRVQSRLVPLQQSIVTAASGNVLSGLAGADDVAAAWQEIDDLDRKSAIIDALMSITIYRTKKGRPPGWQPGKSYFNPAGIEITWKT